MGNLTSPRNNSYCLFFHSRTSYKEPYCLLISHQLHQVGQEITFHLWLNKTGTTTIQQYLSFSIHKCLAVCFYFSINWVIMTETVKTTLTDNSRRSGLPVCNRLIKIRIPFFSNMIKNVLNWNITD